jgi:hypothetical protein
LSFVMSNAQPNFPAGEHLDDGSRADLVLERGDAERPLRTLKEGVARWAPRRTFCATSRTRPSLLGTPSPALRPERVGRFVCSVARELRERASPLQAASRIRTPNSAPPLAPDAGLRRDADAALWHLTAHEIWDLGPVDAWPENPDLGERVRPLGCTRWSAPGCTAAARGYHRAEA